MRMFIICSFNNGFVFLFICGYLYLFVYLIIGLKFGYFVCIFYIFVMYVCCEVINFNVISCWFFDYFFRVDD